MLDVPVGTIPVGTIVRLNSRGTGLQRKLTAHGGAGIAYTTDGDPLTQAEAIATFVWLGHQDGRDAHLRSVESGRQGWLARDMLRRA